MGNSLGSIVGEAGEPGGGVERGGRVGAVVLARAGVSPARAGGDVARGGEDGAFVDGLGQAFDAQVDELVAGRRVSCRRIILVEGEAADLGAPRSSRGLFCKVGAAAARWRESTSRRAWRRERILARSRRREVPPAWRTGRKGFNH